MTPTARIRSKVQSRAKPFLFAVSKIDKKICLRVFLDQKHEFDVFITPQPLEIRFLKFLCKFRRFCKNWKKFIFRRFLSNRNINSCFWAKNTPRQNFLSILGTAKRNGSARDRTLDLMRAVGATCTLPCNRHFLKSLCEKHYTPRGVKSR